MTRPAGVPELDAEIAERNTNDVFSPIKVIEVELTEPLPRLIRSEQYGSVWMLARLCTEPIGVCIASLGEGGISADQLATLLWRELNEPIAERLAAAGITERVALTGAGLKVDSEASPFLRRRSAILDDAPFISVVICTRDREDQLQKCLNRLEQQEYPRFEIVVVDNAPTSDAVLHIVKGRVDNGVNFRYCLESRPGLSWARNAGVAAATSDIIAFLDDDDEPDRYWLAGIADGFARSARIGCVTGIVLPATLDTSAEVLFEQIGGHVKGRGFARETFSRSGPQSPLYPLPPFGAGANMAFLREVIDRIGGFDVALGTGTSTGAGEDTLAMTLAMLSGYEIAYEPAALMWHHHRPDMAGLTRQLHAYSIGLTAFYAALIKRRPSVLPGLLGLLPAILGYLTGAASSTADERQLPENVNRRHRQGMLMGPFAYIGSTCKQRRVAWQERKRVR
jgi:GT2 family glycosyltransferase